MMRHSDADSRDHLFSANAAINVGLAGAGSLLAGWLPTLFGRLLGVGAESAAAYQAAFGVAGGGLLCSLVPLLLVDDRHVGEDAAAREPREARPGGRDWSIWRTPRRWLEAVPEPWRGMVRRPGPLLQLLVPPLWISWGAALLMPYLNLFFKERWTVGDETLGVIFAALGLVTGVTALFGPMVSARWGKIGAIVLTQGLSIPFLLIMGFAPVLGVAVGAALLRAALFNMGSPLYDAWAMERTEERLRPIVIGLINGAYTVGYLVAPEISAVVQERYGFGPLFVATAICYGGGIATMALFWLRPPASGTLAASQ